MNQLLGNALGGASPLTQMGLGNNAGGSVLSNLFSGNCNNISLDGVYVIPKAYYEKSDILVKGIQRYKRGLRLWFLKV